MIQLEVDAQLLRQGMTQQDDAFLEQCKINDKYVEALEVSERIIQVQQDELKELVTLLNWSLDQNEKVQAQLTVADAQLETNEATIKAQKKVMAQLRMNPLVGTSTQGTDETVRRQQQRIQELECQVKLERRQRPPRL